MNEICIVYDSPHKGNTEKLLLKIKEKYADTALVKAADCTPEFFPAMTYWDLHREFITESFLRPFRPCSNRRLKAM